MTLLLLWVFVVGVAVGAVLFALALWYGSLPNERPRCGCGHEVKDHHGLGCIAMENGYQCRCHYTRAQARENAVPR
jgi:hypothetical protein